MKLRVLLLALLIAFAAGRAARAVAYPVVDPTCRLVCPVAGDCDQHPEWLVWRCGG